MKTGIPKLDMLLNGGIKEKSSVLFCAEPGVTNTEFAQQFLFNVLEKGFNGIYFTNNKPPAVIKKVLSDYGWDCEHYESNQKLFFIDSFSRISAQESQGEFTVKDPLDLDKIEETLFTAFKNIKGRQIPLVFDSLCSLFDTVGTENKVLPYLKKWIKTAQLNNITPIFLFTEWPYGRFFNKHLHELFDCVVEIRAVEQEVILRNYFSVSKANWLGKITKREIPFKITKPGGIKIYIPKILVTGPFNAGKTSFVHSSSTHPVSVDRLGTTIALDHGHIDFQGFDTDLFGTPGQERFDPILEYLGGESIGVIIVVDSTDHWGFPRAQDMIVKTETIGLPTVIVANKSNLEGALTPDEIRFKMQIPENIPIIPVTAENLDTVREDYPCLLKKQDVNKVLSTLFNMVI